MVFHGIGRVMPKGLFRSQDNRCPRHLCVSDNCVKAARIHTESSGVGGEFLGRASKQRGKGTLSVSGVYNRQAIFGGRRGVEPACAEDSRKKKQL